MTELFTEISKFEDSVYTVSDLCINQLPANTLKY